MIIFNLSLVSSSSFFSSLCAYADELDVNAAAESYCLDEVVFKFEKRGLAFDVPLPS